MSSFSPGFWTRVLAEKGLESPGYHEAVKATNESTKAKKAQNPTDKPKTQKSKRKKK